MKTAVEIWVKVCNENDLGYSDCAIIAMKEYASQAIDEAAEKAQIIDKEDSDTPLNQMDSVTRYNPSAPNETFIVSKQSILSVKNDLK